MKVVDVVEAVLQLENQGYTREYRIKNGRLHDLGDNSLLAPADIHVDAALRLVGSRNEEDASNIYAICDLKADAKGLLVDAFDIFDEICDRELAKQLAQKRDTTLVEGSAIPSRYGLRKVYKAEFDGDPERYVLRVDYPDFPECPVGQSFSVLGFDTAAQAYVWLVPSILRDSRLNRIPYRGAENSDAE